jgi:hypothetical protein
MKKPLGKFKVFSRPMTHYLGYKNHTDDSCKVLLNKDHATCGKGRFTRNPDRSAVPPRSGSYNLGEMGSGLYRRGRAMEEGESLWSLIICDHQMEQVDMPG